MKAIIMAGGEGQRLRPLTDEMPKPMLPLCGRPVILYIMDLLSAHGITDVMLALRYRGEQIENLFPDGKFGNINLSFSYEDHPLGTAGCVKKAARFLANTTDGSNSTPRSAGARTAACSDNFIVISGDALCDFDLSAAVKFHNGSNAKATIITNRVPDPREYGLVMSDEFGKVKGFSEKPNLTGCECNTANTGTYILSRRVLDMIPPERNFDFAKDVFPRMLEAGGALDEHNALYAYESASYWKDVGDMSSYVAAQIDMLHGRVNVNLPRSYTKIADKNSVILIGENVRLGTNTLLSDCVIESGAVIGDGAQISGAVIGNSASIGNFAEINGAVIANNAVVEDYAAVCAGAVVGASAKVGCNAVVEAGVKVYGRREVKGGCIAAANVRYGAARRIELYDGTAGGACVRGILGTDITPAFMCRLGQALCRYGSGGTKITIAVSNKTASRSELSLSCTHTLKTALIAGISGAGGDVLDCGTVPTAMLLYTAKETECDLTVRIIPHKNREIEINILDSDGLPPERERERGILAALNGAEDSGFAETRTVYGRVTRIRGIEQDYAEKINGLLTRKVRSGKKDKKSAVTANAKNAAGNAVTGAAKLLKNGIFSNVLPGGNLSFGVNIECPSPQMKTAVEAAFRKAGMPGVSAPRGDRLTIRMNYEGTSADMYITNGESSLYLSRERLVTVLAAYIREDGGEAALPTDFPRCIDENIPGLLRYNTGKTPKTAYEIRARQVARKQEFLTQGAVLTAEILRRSAAGEVLSAGVLPFYGNAVARVSLPREQLFGVIADVRAATGGIYGDSVMLRPSRSGTSLFVRAEAGTAEAAEEICRDLSELIGNLTSADA